MTRWDSLFDDLEAQLAAEESREWRAEVTDRTRRERALVDLVGRLLGSRGRDVHVRAVGGSYHGRLQDVGPDWLLLATAFDRQVLLPLAVVRCVTGLPPGSHQPSVVARGLKLGSVLRSISRDRAPVELVDRDGVSVTGTIDAVGMDYLELSDHPLDEVRRAANVRARHVVPLDALAALVHQKPAS